METVTQLLQLAINHPIIAILIPILLFITIKLSIWGFRFLWLIKFVKPNLVTIRIQLPRQDSQKDKEKSDVKDFKEQLGIMEQFYRNINEFSELNLKNLIRTTIFKDDIISFELVAHQRLVDFYVVLPKRYQSLLEKQITSYYPNADIIIEDPIDLKEKTNHIKCYYAHQAHSFFYPIRTYKHLSNDPLNNLSNIFSKLDTEDIAIIQLTLRPIKNRKFQKKTEKAGSKMFSGKDPEKKSLIPGLGFIGSIFSTLIYGPNKNSNQQKQSSGPYGGGGYVRMLQTREDVAKQIGEKSRQVLFDTMIRIIGSGKLRIKSIQRHTNELVSNKKSYPHRQHQ